MKQPSASDGEIREAADRAARDNGEQLNDDAAEKPAQTICALIAFTRTGCELAMALVERLKTQAAFAQTSFSVAGPARFAGELGIDVYESLGAWTAAQFSHADALVYISATGIAVRAIAPHVRDKFSDPAVVSVDEAGRFAVPLLSGHVGGANELARAVALATGGQAVVSTATDVNRLFAVDEWAARRGYTIVERAVAKQISARLLEGGSVGFASDFDLDWDVPAGVIAIAGGNTSAQAEGENLEAQADDRACVETPDVGFVVSLDETCQPFQHTLHLVPRVVTVGVGCRRGTELSAVSGAVDAALAAARVSPRAVVALASIDVKSDERALHELAHERGWDLRFYTADELAAVPGDFAASEFVKRTVGVDNVCERSALAQGGRLLLGKQSGNGVTVALGMT